MAERANELADLARADPEAALAECDRLADDGLGDVGLSVLERTRGLALRVLGRVDDARDALGAAVAYADAAGEPLEAARARAQLGVVHAYAGRFDAAIEHLEDARSALPEADLVDADINLAGVHARLGDVAAARDLLDGAVALCEGGGWSGPLADALTNRGLLAAYGGDLPSARADLERALQVYVESGDDLGVAQTQHNLGFVAGRHGELRAALDWFGQADAYLASIETWSETVMAFGVADTLLAAGLASEAADRARSAAVRMERNGLSTDASEARLLQAHALARDAQYGPAETAARDAVDAFTEQGRPGWAAEAKVIVARCALARDDTESAIELLRSLVSDLDGLARGEAWRDATLLLADALEATGGDGVDGLLADVGDGDLPLHQAAMRDLVHARRLVVDGRPEAAVDLVRGVLRSHAALRATLDAVDVRAAMGEHTRSLRQVARRAAVQMADIEALHELAEWGALSAIEPPPMSPPKDSRVARLLSDLRHVTAEMREAERELAPVDDLAGEVRRLQRDLADASRRIGGRERAAVEPVSLGEVADRLDGRSYVRFVPVDGAVHRVSIIDGSVQSAVVGDVEGIASDTARLASGLAREVRGSKSQRAVESARRAVDAAGDRLALQLFSDIDDRLGVDVVIVGTGLLDVLAWQLLPSLRGRAVTVSPAAGLIRRTEVSAERVALVAGPGLAGAVEEIDRLAQLHAHAVVLAGADSSADGVRLAMAAADLVHVAAHASLERGQPLLSSIELADGPLYVHDLLAVDEPPAQVIFSACESARGSDVLGGEMLGLASALLTRGSHAVVGTKIPLPDNEPTHVAMERLHRLLLDGQTIAAALGAVAAGGDPAARVAGAMVVLGR